VAAVVLAVIATGAGRIAIADAFSERSVQSFAKGSCAAATKQARKAADLADLRPESSRVLGLCSARAHDYAAAAKQLDRAVELDPGHWRSWYDLALVRAAGRLPGPGRAAYAASLRNPSEPFLRFAARDLRSPSRQTVRDARRQISEARNDLPGS
jgi:tetratricopeptide (TPR) repeat protein